MTAWAAPSSTREDAAESGPGGGQSAPSLILAAQRYTRWLGDAPGLVRPSRRRALGREVAARRRLRAGARLRQHLPRGDVEPRLPAGVGAGAPPAGLDLRALLRRRRGSARLVETESPLGAFGCVAFSVSFEEDFVNLLAMLRRSGIPLRRGERDASHPLVVMGGSCSMINPLPMSAFVDVFTLGAAENLLATLLPLLEEESRSRDAVLERLAAMPGFYVPEHHRPEDDLELQSVTGKLRKLELIGRADAATRAPAHQRDRDAAHRVRRQVPGRDVARLPREVPLLLGDLRHGHLPLAPGRLHPRGRSSVPAASPTSSASSPPPSAITPRSSASSTTRAQLGFRTAVSSIRIPAVTDPCCARSTARATARSRWRPRPAPTSCGSRWQAHPQLAPAREDPA